MVFKHILIMGCIKRKKLETKFKMKKPFDFKISSKIKSVFELAFRSILVKFTF